MHVAIVHGVGELPIFIARKKGLQVVDEEQAVGERDDSGHVGDTREKRGRRDEGGVGGDLVDTEDFVDRQCQRSPRRPAQEQVIGDLKFAGTEAKPRPKVENGQDGTPVVHGADDNGRASGERRDGHHGNDAIDLREVKGVPLPIEAKDHDAPYGALNLQLHFASR